MRYQVDGEKRTLTLWHEAFLIHTWTEVEALGFDFYIEDAAGTRLKRQREQEQAQQRRSSQEKRDE